ncbi:sigma-70 RNA polymerase sigma factor region 4 domain-containing protein [Portibacter lacus]|uniref:Sigma-70 family RNA polymerase sigma factor n=1 Tax=Portibacter lacus TaxID=1099794 RepID=A0AA37WFJ5_9BACT|nr:hypothetical protein [Portibacter lacus]GLR17714.1 hypothetical protein GCM10007940_23290 [Portibacter lacus]
MSGRPLDKDNLLELIRSGKAGRDEALVYLYHDQKLRNSFKKMIRNQGWQASNFDSIFNNSLILFASTVIRRPDFELTSDLRNYIIVIGKNTFIKERKGKLSTVELEEHQEMWIDYEVPEKLMIDFEQKQLVEELLDKLGKNCREVLSLWANSYNMKEIADAMNYKSDMMARKKKYQCLKELVDYVSERPHLKSLLKRK